MTNHTVLWLAAVDWDAPWQGAQTLATRLAADGHSVTFVETLGVRSAGWRDRGRLINRLRNRIRGGLRGFRTISENLSLLSPLLIPAPGRAWAERLNLQMLLRTLRRMPRGGPLLVWTYLPTPLVVQLVGTLRPALLIYSCIDEVRANPAGCAPGVAGAEDWLTSHADHIFATSRSLYTTRKEKNTNITYLPEGADVSPFMTPRPEPADLAAIPRPRICFFGTLDGRLDQALLARVMAAFPDASLVLIGPKRCDLSTLRRQPNAHLLGPRAHGELAAYLQHMDLFVIPYHINAYTIHIHPVKTYEALATGLPLVTTDLPELRPYAGSVTVAGDDAAFLKGVSAGLRERDVGLADARRQIALENTWDVRYRVIQATLEELSSRGSSQ